MLNGWLAACAGITWVLSDEVVHMSDEAWHRRYLHLRGIAQQTGAARVDGPTHSEALHDWLEHQKALAALGNSQAYVAVQHVNSCKLPTSNVCVT